jgi:hypothetical protein
MAGLSMLLFPSQEAIARKPVYTLASLAKRLSASRFG